MAIKNGLDCLWLIWKDPVSRKQYVVGEMEKNGGYSFRYTAQVEEIQHLNFPLLLSFEDTSKEYHSERLFPIFSSRLPDPKRAEIARLLHQYGLDEYDEYELLKRSGARTPIDSFAFIDPIFETEMQAMTRHFYIAGARHYLTADTLPPIGTALTLRAEPENPYDPHALRMETPDGTHVGYLPRYYALAVQALMRAERRMTCHVLACSTDMMGDIQISAQIHIEQA